MKLRGAPTVMPAGLTRNVVEVLLGGWGAPVIEPSDFAEFDSDLPALWRTHRALLLQEWRRRGGTGRPWAAEQFGDA
jgi:hypothetical protein